MGLVSDGGVHSHRVTHIVYQNWQTTRTRRSIYPLFGDGRDTPPKVQEIILVISRKTKELGIGKIFTISGRYYAMDRDTRWERTKLAYDALVRRR